MTAYRPNHGGWGIQKPKIGGRVAAQKIPKNLSQIGGRVAAHGHGQCLTQLPPSPDLVSRIEDCRNQKVKDMDGGQWDSVKFPNYGVKRYHV